MFNKEKTNSLFSLANDESFGGISHPDFTDNAMKMDLSIQSGGDYD